MRQWIEGNLRLVLRFFEECWNGGNVALLDELLAPNHVHHLPGKDLNGPGQVKELVLTLRSAIPGFHITLDEVIVAGDKIVCRWTIQGKNIVCPGIDIVRCADNRIVEVWSQYDSSGLVRQLSQGATRISG